MVVVLRLPLVIKKDEKKAVVVAQEDAKKEAAAKPADERIEDFLATDPMEIEIGVGLIRLADPKRGGDLLERIQRVRQNVAGEIGIIMPKVRIRDNVRLDPQQYRIKIADVSVAEGLLEPSRLLAMDSQRDYRQGWRARNSRTGIRDSGTLDRSRAAKPS